MNLITLVLVITAIGYAGFALATNTDGQLLLRLTPRGRLIERIKVKARFNSINTLLEIPDFSALLWFLVSSGLPLEGALRLAVSRSQGFVSGEFHKVLKNVDHGALFQHELENLAASSKSEQVRELATKLAVCLANGSGLAEQLTEYVSSTTALLRNQMLDRAAKNETKMMLPLVFVILPVTVMFALYPSLVIIQQSFL